MKIAGFLARFIVALTLFLLTFLMWPIALLVAWAIVRKMNSKDGQVAPGIEPSWPEGGSGNTQRYTMRIAFRAWFAGLWEFIIATPAEEHQKTVTRKDDEIDRKVKPTMRKKYVCPKCGGDDMQIDQVGGWSERSEERTIERNTEGNGDWCRTCVEYIGEAKEVWVEEKAAPGEPEKKPWIEM